MKAEVQKVLKLYEELEEVIETAVLTFSTSGCKSTVKLKLQSSSLRTTFKVNSRCNTSSWQASPPSWRKSLLKSAGSCPSSILG